MGNGPSGGIPSSNARFPHGPSALTFALNSLGSILNTTGVAIRNRWAAISRVIQESHHVGNPRMTVSQFYGDLSAHYDLVYADWEGSMARQGQSIHQILRAEFPGRAIRELRILDAAAGIGTQAIPLAQLGYQVVARDLSRGAVVRLVQEARARGLRIDSAAADMREVSGTVEGSFDAVIAMDNSVPHLLTDEEIVIAFQEFRRVLLDRGRLLISVRDYEKVDRAPTSVHPYGKRTRDGRTYRLEQRWEWTDPEHYSTTFIFEEAREGAWSPVLRTQAEYDAIPKLRLLGLMKKAGFKSEEVKETSCFQPVLIGRLGEYAAFGGGFS